MTQLTLNLVQGAVSFNFSRDAAKQLQDEISTLMQSLKAIQRGPGGFPAARSADRRETTGGHSPAQRLNQEAIATASTGGGSRPSKQESMEYSYTGDVFLEIFCNPNIYPSPFAAKILITLRDDRIRLTSEAELTQLIEDLNLFFENN